MSLNAKTIINRHDAVEKGEVYGTQMGVVLAAFIVLLYITGHSPLCAPSTALIASVAILAVRVVTGLCMGRSWDGYDAKRQALQQTGMEYQEAFDAVAHAS